MSSHIMIALLLLLLAVIFWKSAWVQYHVKMFGFAIAAVGIGTILPLPLLILRPMDYRNAL